MSDEKQGNAVAIPEADYRKAVAAIVNGDEVEGFAGDGEAATQMILQRILSAETFSDAFAPQTLERWSDMQDVPVSVTDFRFNRSGFDQGSPIYAVVDLVIRAGEREGEAVTVHCGGRNVLAQLLIGLQKGWLKDNPVKMTSKKTGEGFNVLWLVPA